jgi:hypothetical protein
MSDTIVRSLNITMGAPAVQERKEKPFVRVFEIARDDNGVEIAALTFRCATEDLVFGEINPETKQFAETLRIPRGHLDPRNRGSMVSFRMNAKIEETGAYQWLGSFDVSHAEQQRGELVRDAQSGKRYRRLLPGTPVAHFSRIKLTTVRTPDGSLVEIVNPADPKYQAFNAMCLAAGWPNEPEQTSAPVATPSASSPDSGADLDDLPAE